MSIMYGGKNVNIGNVNKNRVDYDGASPCFLCNCYRRGEIVIFMNIDKNYHLMIKDIIEIQIVIWYFIFVSTD